MSGARKGGKRAVRAAIESAAPAEAAAASAKPSVAPEWMSGLFEMRENGIYKKGKDASEGAMWLCGPFRIEAETLDSENSTWGLLLSWCDRDGSRREEVFTRSSFAGECAELRSRLADGGLALNGSPAARQALVQYFNVCASPRRARCVSRIGWHAIGARRIFVLPERIFGEAGERIVLQSTEREPSLFKSGGTLDEWRSEVSRLCIGNSRLLFAASCAFAGPLLGLLGEDGGGFNLRGGSRIGKSTALRVAASVCGGLPGHGAAGFIRQWRATGNGIEAVAGAHSDTLLPLDEMGQVDAREAGEISYLLANGMGKARAARSGSARPALRFRVLFLSTGEIGLADKNAEAGRSTKAGQEVRIADLPADAGAGMGIFEDVHGEANADAFARELRRLTAIRYGVALPAFLGWLDARLRRDPEAFLDALRERVAALLRDWLEAIPQAGGQVRSVGFRFALVGIAGELAAEALVTEWPAGAAADAAGTCFRAWLMERGTAGAAEDAQAVRQLRAFVAAHGSARFDVWAEPAQSEAQQAESDPAHPPAERFRVQHRVGWRRWQPLDNGKHGWNYYLTADGMKEAMRGLAPRESIRTLAALSLIVRPRSGAEADGSRLLTVHRVPGHGPVRLYRLSPDILAGTDDAD